MRMQRNFYEVLGVQRNASKQEIKDKYHSLARQYHPDRAKDKVLADRLFVQINRAYSTLNNDVKRAQYDAGLESMASAPSSAGVPQRQRAPVAPVQVTPQQVREWFDQASRLQLKGELAQAITLCSKTIEADPHNFPGLLLMGDLLAQSGKPVEALAMFDRAVVIQPANRLLREKIARLNAVNARRATNPGLNSGFNGGAARPASSNIVPPSPAQKPPLPPTQKPAAQPEPKSIFDRLMNRK